MPQASLSVSDSTTRFSGRGRSSVVTVRLAVWLKTRRNAAWCPGAPGQAWLVAAHRRADGTVAAHELHLVAAHEAARQVRLVEVLALDRGRIGPLVALDRLVEDARHHAGRVMHQIAADEARTVGDAAWRTPRATEMQQTGRAEPVGGQDHHGGPMPPRLAGRIVIGDPGGATERVRLDFEHARVGHKPNARRERQRPVGDIGAGPCLHRTTHVARPAIVAGAASLAIGPRIDCDIRHPPVPAEPVEGGSHPVGAPEGADRRHGARLARWITRIAVEAGDADDAVVLLVIGGQILVGDRPVVGDAVEGFDLEVGGAEAREVRAPQDGGAPDRVVEQRLDGRFRIVDRGNRPGRGGCSGSRGEWSAGPAPSRCAGSARQRRIPSRPAPGR